MEGAPEEEGEGEGYEGEDDQKREESVSGQFLHGGGSTDLTLEDSQGQPSSQRDVVMNAVRLGTPGRDHPQIFGSDAGKSLNNWGSQILIVTRDIGEDGEVKIQKQIW